MEVSKQDTNPYGKYQVDTNIALNELEQRILTTIMEVVRDNDLKTTVRVAGGWVRDKVRIASEIIITTTAHGEGKCGH